MFSENVNYIDIPGIFLLWVESLAFVLLFIVIVSALASCIKKKLWRRAVKSIIVIIALLLLLVGGVAIYSGWCLLSDGFQPDWFFAYSLLWTLAYVGACYALYKKKLFLQGEKSGSGCCSFGKLVATFGVVTAIFFGTFSMIDSSSKMALLSYSSRLSTQASTMLPSYVPDRKNARIAYEKAYKSLGVTPSWFDNSDKANFDPNSKEVKDFLIAKKETLQLIRTAVAMDDYYFPSTLTFASPIPEYSHYHDLVGLLTIDAKVKAGNSDFTGAYKNIVSIHIMAEHIAQSTPLQGPLVSVGIHGQGASPLEYILASNSPIPKGFKSNFASQYALFTNYKHAVMLEGAIMASDFAYLTATGRQELFGGVGDSILSMDRIFFAPYDFSSWNDYWHQYTELLAKPSYEVIVGLKSLDTEIEEGSFLMALMGPPSLRSNTAGFIIEAQTKLLVADAGVAAVAYKQEYGHYPSTFDDMLPRYLTEVPIDPFTGKAMLMKATKNGLVIYSVGINLKDDGGENYNRYKKTGDVAFYLGDAYNEYRVKPALAKEKEQAKKRAEYKAKKEKEAGQ